MLLSKDSPHLQISEQGLQYRVQFNGEEMFFLKADTLLLPVRNATVEEYARYLLERLLEDRELIARHDIREVSIKVSSGPGQWGSCRWKRARDMKTLVVTGGSKGIGLATAELFAAQGYRVVNLSRSAIPLPGAIQVSVDMADPGWAERHGTAVLAALGDGGQLVLVHNAAVPCSQPKFAARDGRHHPGN